MPDADNGTRSLDDRLRSVFEHAKLPTNPAIAVEILRLSDDPESSAEQFASAIAADPALAGRLLEMANTAHFVQREPVTSIRRAVTLLGLRRIRMVSLGFQLVAHLNKLGGADFDLKRFWQHSVLRASLAREVAAICTPERVEEAFLIGLLQDCGILLLVQVYGEAYAELHAMSLSPTAFFELEQRRFTFDHAQAINSLAQQWSLPPMVAEPLSLHHTPVTPGPDASAVDRLSAVSYLVGSLPLAKGRPAASEPGLLAYASEVLGLDEPQVRDCLARAGDTYGHLAPLLAEHLPQSMDVTELLDLANLRLSRVATEADQRAEAVEAERDAIRRKQEQLKSALGQYRDRAARDPLTRLLNRGALADATLSCIRECNDRNLAVAVYFLDIDDFKVINDEYGHHVGDEVLRGLAGGLSGSVVNGGFAGRYGGEEFIVVIPALDADDARQRAQRLVDGVRNSLPAGAPPRTVTCSVGAVWGHPRPGTSPQELFAAADELMYRAKIGGKDRCCFKTLESPDSIETLGPTGSVSPDQEPAGVTAEQFRELAVELNRNEPRRFATMRKRERRGMLASCVVHSFVSGVPTLRSYPGYLRNISTGGAGVLTTRPMIRGEPVEVAIEERADDEALMYVGGLVAFCRHVRDGIYEVGIQLVAQGNEPIFPRDAAESGAQLDWVMEALRSSHGRAA